MARVTVTSAAKRAEAAWFMPLTQPVRLALVRALAAGERSAEDLSTALHVPFMALAHQIKALRNAGYIATHRQGRTWMYRLVNVEVTPTRLTFTHRPSGAMAVIAREG